MDLTVYVILLRIVQKQMCIRDRNKKGTDYLAGSLICSIIDSCSIERGTRSRPTDYVRHAH